MLGVRPALEHANVTMLTIDPHYFTTLGLPLQRGRNINDEDGMVGRESAVINQRFAALHFFNPVARMPLIEVIRSKNRMPSR